MPGPGIRCLFAWAGAALEWLYPDRCVLCLAPARGGICVACAADLVAHGPACPTCAEPLPVADACPACLRAPPALDAVSVPFAYAWPLSQLLLGYKRGGRPQLGRPLAQLLSDHLPTAATQGVDCVIPVPLHEQRRAQRGFNQAEALARVLCRRRGLPLDTGAVRRVVATPSQQGLSRRARKVNLRGAFTVERDLRGSRVLLVDDVMTTGTTLTVLAREVRRAGADWVGAVALARA
ncbi:ComF family protein [Thioalkalivibrio sp.]|uniref:ComF family protein n=1 Tax=Thioalkalivibrio sp. TaxID=2093813 RepID=UPI003976C199